MARIYVTIEVGRRAYDCTRVGICSITIGAELSLRPNQEAGFIEIASDQESAMLFLNDGDGMIGISRLPVDEYVPFSIKDCLGAKTAYAVVPGVYTLTPNGATGHLTAQLALVHHP